MKNSFQTPSSGAFRHEEIAADVARHRDFDRAISATRRRVAVCAGGRRQAAFRIGAITGVAARHDDCLSIPISSGRPVNTTVPPTTSQT
jgi:hypothetical protein